MPSFLPFGKVGEFQIRRCRGFAVADYGFTLGALALKPSDFCNIRVRLAPHRARTGLQQVVVTLQPACDTFLKEQLSPMLVKKIIRFPIGRRTIRGCLTCPIPALIYSGRHFSTCTCPENTPFPLWRNFRSASSVSIYKWPFGTHSALGNAT